MNHFLTDELFKDLETGVLNPFLKLVHEDTTLDMEFRCDEVSIYYRGGKLYIKTRWTIISQKLTLHQLKLRQNRGLY